MILDSDYPKTGCICKNVVSARDDAQETHIAGDTCQLDRCYQRDGLVGWINRLAWNKIDMPGTEQRRQAILRDFDLDAVGASLLSEGQISGSKELGC